LENFIIGLFLLQSNCKKEFSNFCEYVREKMKQLEAEKHKVSHSFIRWADFSLANSDQSQKIRPQRFWI
jgi:hypothetical protein